MMETEFQENFTEETIEETPEIRIVNRSVLIAHLNEGFYAWYKTQVANPKTEEEIMDSPFSFLIPPVETEEEADEHLAGSYLEIFESILSEFIESDEVIEAALTEENFDNWVDYNFSSFVLDAASDFELSYEDEDSEQEENEATEYTI